MNTTFALNACQWRGVWGERTEATAGRGYCANLGHPEDETGLVYMRARYYEPATGRFISEDPARDGVNWYLYADGNPVNRVDFEGKRAMSPVLQAFIAGILIGYFGSLGYALGPGGDLSWGKIKEAMETSLGVATTGAIIGTMVGWLFKAAFGSEGALFRIPQRIGYLRGFLFVAETAFLGGWGAAAVFYYGMRAGQILFELFRIDFIDIG